MRAALRTLASSRRGLAVTGLMLVASVAAFAHLAEDYLTGDPIVRWDLEFARWLNEHASSRLVSVFDVVAVAGNAGY